MPRGTGLLRFAALLVPAGVLAGCASIHHESTFGLDDPGAELVRQTCAEIMGLGVSAEYQACGGSLAEYVRALRRASVPSAETTAMARPGIDRPTKPFFVVDAKEQSLRAKRSCAQIGLHPSSGGHGTCVTDLELAIATVRHWPGS